METDLAAKARRAAEWLNARDTVKFSPEIRKGTKVRWLIQALNTGVYFERTDRELIAFCEDRGWQDTEPDAGNVVDGVLSQVLPNNCDTSQVQSGSSGCEADGVDWEPTSEFARVSGLTAWVHRGKDHWYWEVNDDCRERTRDSGTALTRAEARAAAVEAARGMG